jgi:Flp pilus assembly pilin Flp
MASLRSKLGDERGATTLEYVIIAAIVCVAAIALAAVIVSAIQSFQARIPTGP